MYDVVVVKQFGNENNEEWIRSLSFYGLLQLTRMSTVPTKI